MTQMPEEYDRSAIPGAAGSDSEYALRQRCVARMAARAGRTAEYDYFMRAPGITQHLGFPHRLSCVRARRTVPGSIFQTIRRQPGKIYVRRIPWQWRWFVPHDVPGMIEMMRRSGSSATGLFFSNHLYRRQPARYPCAFVQHGRRSLADAKMGSRCSPNPWSIVM